MQRRKEEDQEEEDEDEEEGDLMRWWIIHTQDLVLEYRDWLRLQVSHWQALLLLTSYGASHRSLQDSGPPKWCFSLTSVQNMPEEKSMDDWRETVTQLFDYSQPHWETNASDGLDNSITEVRRKCDLNTPNAVITTIDHYIETLASSTSPVSGVPAQVYRTFVSPSGKAATESSKELKFHGRVHCEAALAVLSCQASSLSDPNLSEIFEVCTPFSSLFSF